MSPPLTWRPPTQYRGRFAPSPSGLLHFGSLIAAIASYLDAKSNQGVWLVRIEDIDPPREQLGAASEILRTLESCGLHWDESVLYQSAQSELYRSVLSDLQKQKLSYHCQCTRAQIKAIGGIYQGQCRTLDLPQTGCSTRLVNTVGIDHFDDLIQGHSQCDRRLAKEDFILLRKDGLFAYQLAVVVDEIYQGITHVIRGSDLLEPTVRQLTLFNTLDIPAPQYGHFPVAETHDGYKLSKQNKATPINRQNPVPEMIKALKFLGQSVDDELLTATPEELLSEAVIKWRRERIPNTAAIVINSA